ncbi:MAG: serine/threonine protein kinase [Planctomycetota bacterium]|nr:MAG: serine/threonine protein kinase [Planctomycetota bacterium]
MTRASDLLFGLLALQMNFISKGQLLECAALWMNDSKAVLGKLFLDRGYLKQKQHAGVAAMVAAQVDAHDGDAAQSLAAVEVDMDLRQSLLALNVPPDLRQSLAWVQARGKSAARPFTVAPAAEGRYRLGEELGRGGLGQVVTAFDASLEREIAVKLALDGVSAEVADRFVREAKLAGRLDHPNIVPIFDFGTLGGASTSPGQGGRLFMAMKRVRGRDLGKVLAMLGRGDAEARERWSRTILLQVFLEICNGMAFAHDRGVIHRDLKPANVMLGDYGEVHIVDWGLARVLNGQEDVRTRSVERSRPQEKLETALTLEGEVIGTPAYMPPEQAEGRLSGMDRRSDIYSLGAILYEILTFKPPFEGGSAKEILDKVRTGGIVSPSGLFRANAEDSGRTVAGGRTAPLDTDAIPRELDTICLKALAYRREDRFQTVMELHREIRLFLEGVKEAARVEKEAREWLQKGRFSLHRFGVLKGEIDAQAKLVEELSERIKPHLGAEEKQPLWNAEERHRRLQDEQIEAFAAASAEFGHALSLKGDMTEARDGMCELFLDQFLAAEKRRDRKEMLLNRRTLESFDAAGRKRARLDAPGYLSIRTMAYECDCLKPVPDRAWRVEFSDSCEVPWRDGRPRPDLPLTDEDCPVPAVRTYPKGARWGHRAGCPRREISGVEVFLGRYEERGKRLHLGELKLLGTTPLKDIELPQGSYRCTLRGSGFTETLLPVRIDRGGVWTQVVNLYRPDEIPPGFRYVPGGPFIFGEFAFGGVERTQVTEDVFVSRFPVIAGEYLEFLNELCAEGRADEARSRQPREGNVTYFREVGGRFEVMPESEKGALLTSQKLPAMGMSWNSAQAWIAWHSGRDGRPYRLLHEQEWEKAARGVDARRFPWGSGYDGSFSNSSLSHAEGARICEPGSYPVDESPYGIADLGGNMETWCWNALESPYRMWRSIRIGSWANNRPSQAAGRKGNDPAITTRVLGFRLALSPG